MDHVSILGRPTPGARTCAGSWRWATSTPTRSWPRPRSPSACLQRWLAHRHLSGGARITAFNVDFDQPMLDRGVASSPFLARAWAPCHGRGEGSWAQRAPCPGWATSATTRTPASRTRPPLLRRCPAEPAHRALADARTAALIAVALQQRALAAREAS